MRNRLLGFGVVLVASACLALWVGSAQARPQAAATQSPPAYRAPRTPDGKPNLSGIWQSMNEANWNIEAHSADFPACRTPGRCGRVPPGAGIVEGGPIPYLPAALAKRKENYEKRLALDPEIKCYLPGTPRAHVSEHAVSDHAGHGIHRDGLPVRRHFAHRSI